MKNEAELEHANFDARPVAVIDIGTAAIRMALADIDSNGVVTPLEKLNQSVPLGQNTFTRGRIQRRTIEECVRIIRSFQEIMAEYRVKPGDVRAVATSAVQEAGNRQQFVDRLFMATGIQIEVIEEAEATRLTYFSMLPYLRKRKKKDSRTFILEVGGGRSELIALEDDRIVGTRAVRLGSLRLRHRLEQQHTPASEVRNVLAHEIDHYVGRLSADLGRKPDTLVVLGGDARFLAGIVQPEWDQKSLQRVGLKQWTTVVDRLLDQTPEQLVQEHHLTFEETDTLAPAVFAVQRIATALKLSSLQVSGFTMRDGLLQQMAEGGTGNRRYVRQMIASAKEIGTKYQIDEKHGAEVADLSLQLFDALEGEHNLSAHDRVLLEIAARLHEVGNFVAATSHHKHSHYLLMNSDVFGLGKRDTRIVANVARYHRRSAPKSTHTSFASLSRVDRIRVLQLSAILRVADSLARSRGKRIRQIECERRGDDFVIRVPNVDNLHLETTALESKGGMFEDVFGKNVILVKG